MSRERNTSDGALAVDIRSTPYSDTVRILTPPPPLTTSWSRCFPFFSSRKARIPFAVGPGSSCWVNGDTLHHCPTCDVEFSSTHKHVTRRHCRMCGGVFCYTCTFDKVTLRSWPDGACLPINAKKTAVHVCSSCFDSCPPPADGMRRCRFCHQRVRLAFHDAHTSVCLEEQYAKAQFAPQQLLHWGGGRVCGSASGGSSSSAGASSSSAAAAAASSSLASSPRNDPIDIGLEDASITLPSDGHTMTTPLSPGLSSAASQPATPDVAASPTDGARGQRPLREITPDLEHESGQCVICMGSEANAAIVPCGHTVACVRCLERCDACPVCRKPIQTILRIYRS